METKEKQRTGLLPRPRTLAFGLIAFVLACVPPRGVPTSDVTTTSGRFPRPASTPASTHTVDNAGFVDNGGRTSDEVARTQMSGMRVTELQSERITGTPGSGLPVPGLDPPAKAKGSPEAPRPRASVLRAKSGVPYDHLIGRAVQALCDHAVVCTAVGPSARWQTTTACMDDLRPRAQEDLGGRTCPYGYDATAVANCLAELRRRACEATPLVAVADVPACVPRDMCAGIEQ